MKWAAVLSGVMVWATGAAGGGGTAWGDPLTGTGLPLDTRWVIHVDVDAGRLATPLWDLARKRIVEPVQPLVVLERITGMKVPQDLHDVTLYGAAYDEATVCLVIHGKMDETAVTAFLRADPEFRQQDHNGHTVMTWRDRNRDRLMYAAFARSDVVVVSPSTKVVEEALDARDGKTSRLKPDSPLLPAVPPDGAGPGSAKLPIVWLAGQNLSDLPRAQKVETPLLSAMESASLGVRWVDDRANGRAIAELFVQAKTDQAAQQLQAVAEGIKALVALTAADEHAPPPVRLFSGVLQQLTVHAEGQTLKGEWPVELDKIESVLNLAAPANAAGALTAPAKKLP